MAIETMERPKRLELAGAPPRGVGKRQVTFETVTPHAGHRVVLYGPGGIGKTTLADLAPGPVVKYPAPKRPVSLAYASTAIETACSWCRQMGARPFAQARPSVRCMIPPPESMKTCRTPMSRMKAAR